MYTITGLRGAWLHSGDDGSWTRGVRQHWPACTQSQDYGGPGYIQETGYLGLGASGHISQLVHDHGLRRAWYLLGVGGSCAKGVSRCWPPCTRSKAKTGLALAPRRGSCTKGVRRGWPMSLLKTLLGEAGAIQRRPVVGSLVQLSCPPQLLGLRRRDYWAGTPCYLLLGDEENEDNRGLTNFCPLVLRLGGGR